MLFKQNDKDQPTTSMSTDPTLLKTKNPPQPTHQKPRGSRPGSSQTPSCSNGRPETFVSSEVFSDLELAMEISPLFNTHRIHGTIVYLPTFLPYKSTKCRYAYHTWILWNRKCMFKGSVFHCYVSLPECKLLLWIGCFGILGLPLSNNPFQKGIPTYQLSKPPTQTTK